MTHDPTDRAITEARLARLNQALLNLASWCQARTMTHHNTETTLVMLERKASAIRAQVDAAGWVASRAEEKTR